MWIRVFKAVIRDSNKNDLMLKVKNHKLVYSSPDGLLRLNSVNVGRIRSIPVKIESSRNGRILVIKCYSNISKPILVYSFLSLFLAIALISETSYLFAISFSFVFLLFSIITSIKTLNSKVEKKIEQIINK